MKKPVISFDKKLTKEMLKIMEIYPNADGFLIKDGDYIRAFDDGHPIHIEQFGGMWKGKNGQMIFFHSDLPSLINVLEKINEEEKSKGVV